MKILGIPLRKPSSTELTASLVLAAGLWLASVGLLRTLDEDLSRFDAGALLLVITWSCFGARLGIRVGTGHRHLMANLLVSGGLLLVYYLGWSIFF
jgi:hypothetical protein